MGANDESVMIRSERKKIEDGVKVCGDCIHFRREIRGCAAVITIDLISGEPLMSDAAAERYGAKGFNQSCGSEGALWEPRLNG